MRHLWAANFPPVSPSRLTSRGMPREVSRHESLLMLLPLAGGSGTVIKLGELVMILELHRQGLKISAIARQLGMDGAQIHGAGTGAAQLWAATTATEEHRSIPGISARAPGGLSRPH